MMNEKEQLWYTRFLNYANSGMSRTHWCRENGIAICKCQYQYVQKVEYFNVQ